MEAMWINFQCKQDKFVIRPFLGGVNGISGESTASGDMGAFLRKMNKLAPSQDYLVVPEQPWLDGISTEPGVVKQFVAAETAPPRETDNTASARMTSQASSQQQPQQNESSTSLPSEKVIGASVEWQVTGRDSVGGIQLQIIPTFKTRNMSAASTRDVCYLNGGSRWAVSYNPQLEESATAYDVLQTPKELGLAVGDTIHIKNLKSREQDRPKTLADLVSEVERQGASTDYVLDLTVRDRYPRLVSFNVILLREPHRTTQLDVSQWMVYTIQTSTNLMPLLV
jgi:hypothetical protein